MRKARWALLLVSAGLLAGCSFPSFPLGQAAAQQAVAIAGAPAIRSLARPSAAPVSQDMTNLKRQLQEYLAGQRGTYGVYISDLATGRSLGINGDMVFPAASTFKLPMSLYILDQIARGRASFDDEIAYAKADFEAGTGLLQHSIKPGQKVKVGRLVELAITHSDNIATQMLLRRFGVQNVYAYMKSLGGKVTHYEPGVVGTTPREMATFMRQAVTGVAAGNPEHREFLMNALEHTVFADRAAEGVPDGVTVAHKIGTLPGVINDVALVEAPEHPFIISVYSVNVGEDAAPEVIARLTGMTYEFLTGESAGSAADRGSAE